MASGEWLKRPSPFSIRHSSLAIRPSSGTLATFHSFGSLLSVREHYPRVDCLPMPKIGPKNQGESQAK
jgi:hypothetical protein